MKTSAVSCARYTRVPGCPCCRRRRGWHGARWVDLGMKEKHNRGRAFGPPLTVRMDARPLEAELEEPLTAGSEPSSLPALASPGLWLFPPGRHLRSSAPGWERSSRAALAREAQP